MLQHIKILYREAQLAERAFLPLLCEVAAFCVTSGLGPRYFVKAGMGREDFPAAQKKQHISKAKFNRAVEVLNPLLYRKFTQHKLAEKALCALLEIPTAPLLAYYTEGSEAAGGKLQLTSSAELDDFLRQHTSRRICIKPFEGWGGAGVLVGCAHASKERAVFRCDESGEEMDALTLQSMLSGAGKPCEFIIEAHISQTEQFSGFNASSLNTIRVWVLQSGSGAVDVIGAYLRVGRADSVVDNASRGGLMCPVELDSGELQPGLSKQSPHRESLATHPDHAAQLAGVRIDGWAEILEFCRYTLALLPHTRFAGLDIAVTDDGPMLVEANVLPDADGAAHARIPSKMVMKAAGSQ